MTLLSTIKPAPSMALQLNFYPTEACSQTYEEQLLKYHCSYNRCFHNLSEALHHLKY